MQVRLRAVAAVPRARRPSGRHREPLRKALFLNGLRPQIVAARKAAVYAGCIGVERTASAKKKGHGKPCP